MKREESIEAAATLTAALLQSSAYKMEGHLDRDTDTAVDLFARILHKLQEINA